MECGIYCLSTSNQRQEGLGTIVNSYDLMPDMNSVIADNLKNLRRDMHLSLSEAAERTGVSSAQPSIHISQAKPKISRTHKVI